MLLLVSSFHILQKPEYKYIFTTYIKCIAEQSDRQPTHFFARCVPFAKLSTTFISPFVALKCKIISRLKAWLSSMYDFIWCCDERRINVVFFFDTYIEVKLP
jgi:hypothetical protein